MDKNEVNKKGKKRRAKGEGALYQRTDGLWVTQANYWDPIQGKRIRPVFYGKTRKEAIGKKQEWKENFRKGIIISNKLTVAEWMQTWLYTYTSNRVRQNTFEGYERVVNKHIIPVLGHYLLKDLRSEHIQAMLNQKLQTGNLKTNEPLAPRQVEYIYSVLHSALQQALKNQIIARNPCDAVTKPKKKKREFIPWTTEQTNHFLSSVKEKRLFPLYMVAWGTGLRRSEILGLKWDDVDFELGLLYVRRSLVRVKGGYKIQDPKTKKSKRTIPLPDSVTQALKERNKHQITEKLALEAKHGEPASDTPFVYNRLNLVFTNENGQPINPEAVSRAFKRDLMEAQLPDIRFHDLRHGHATQLLELGEDIKVISDRLGHSTITLTADTYSHVREEMQKKASIKLDQILKLK